MKNAYKKRLWTELGLVTRLKWLCFIFFLFFSRMSQIYIIFGSDVWKCFVAKIQLLVYGWQSPIAIRWSADTIYFLVKQKPFFGGIRHSFLICLPVSFWYFIMIYYSYTFTFKWYLSIILLNYILHKILGSSNTIISETRTF